jgi:hypothetical protein
MDEPAPRRHNTSEEIARLGASETRARRRGFAAVLSGLATVGLVAAVIAAVSHREAPQPPPLPPQEAPQLTAATPPAPPEPEVPSAPPSRRSSLSALAPRSRVKLPPSLAPLPVPAGASVPLTPAEEVEVEGLARELVSQKKGAVRLCFEHELKRDPSLTDNVTVTLELRPPRRVAAVSVRDDNHDKALTRCIARAMRSLQLPVLSSDVSVELPFELRGHE